jgi:hypothetical protein
MAMEFAITATASIAEADDSWQPSGSRSFLFTEPRAIINCALRRRRLEQHCV